MITKLQIVCLIVPTLLIINCEPISKTANVLGKFDIDRPARDVFATDSVAYLLSGSYASFSDYKCFLTIVDVSTKARPRKISTIGISGAAGRIEVRDSFAYVLNGRSVPVLGDVPGGFHIIDVSKPLQPMEIGKCVLPKGSLAMTINNTMAYVGIDSVIYFLDLSEPTRPHIVNKFQVNGDNIKDIVVQDSSLYISSNITIYSNDRLTRNGRVTIIDVSDTFNPYIVGFYERLDEKLGARFNFMAIQQNILYTTVEGGGITHGIQIVDVRVPSDIKEIVTSNIDVGFGGFLDLVLAENFLLVCNSSYGVQIYDISLPGQIKGPLGKFSSIYDNHYKISFSNGVAYLINRGYLYLISFNEMPRS